MTFKPQMVAAIQAGRKTVTRRNAGTKLEPGQIRSVQLGMGRESIGTIEIVDVREERLGAITNAEAQLEGVSDRAAFVELWKTIHGKWDPDVTVTRIEFREITRFKTLCSCCGGLGAT